MNVIPYRRSLKRARSSTRSRVPARRIPRMLKYNGENKITRTINAQLAYTQSGFGLSASFFLGVNIVFDPTSVTFYGNSTTFQSFPLVNAAEIAALYDTMRIDKVEIEWSGNSQASTTATVQASALKYLVCNDSNDGIAVATLAEVQQQPNKAFLDIDGRSHKWTCYPQYQRVVYQTALVSNYEPTRGFVNSNSTIPHYGTKMYITNSSSLSGSSAGNVDFTIKYFMTLRNVK